MWLEAILLSTRLARPDGRLVGPLEPLEVGPGLTFGARGAGTDLEWELGRALEVRPRKEGLAFRWVDAKRETLLRQGEVWSFDGVSGPCFRVLSAPQRSLAWPQAVAAPLGPWSDELLAVLGDALLEAGAPVGARLTHRVPEEDADFLPLLPLLPPACVELSWRGGVLDTLALQTEPPPSGAPPLPIRATLSWGLGRALASHAVCKPLRALTLRAPSEQRNELLRLVAGLAAAGLPCLASLRCELWDSPGELESFAAELRLLPGVAAGLPTLRGVEVARFVAGLATPSARDPRRRTPRG